MYINIRSYQAVGDGIADDTKAIQAALDAAHADGGGTVVVPSGRFWSRPLEMYSYTTLHLEPGAVLIASENVSDYFEYHPSQWVAKCGLLRAVAQTNLAITGTGTIDMQGMRFMDVTKARQGDPGPLDWEAKNTRQGERFRRDDHGIEDGPAQESERHGNAIQFMECTNITLRDFNIVDSPLWTIHLMGSDEILIHGVKIKNNVLIPNSDGIHFQNCQNVRVSDCYIEAGDDAIALTGYGVEGSITENVLVANCVLRSRSSALRVGYGKTNMRNLMFTNITIKDSNRGIGITQRDAGVMENLLFSNIVIESRLHSGHWWGHGEAIHVSNTIHNSAVGHGQLKNIRFSNILARSSAGIVLWGTPESIIEDVVFDNIRFDVTESHLACRYGGNFDLRPAEKAAVGLFKHRESGIFAQYVQDLQIRNFQLHWEQADPPEYFAHGIDINDSKNIVIDNYIGEAPHRTPKSKRINLARCEDVVVRNSVED